MKFVAGIAALVIALGLSAGTEAQQTLVGPITPGFNNQFPAKNYGSCTWDSAHDVGPCINSAITAANTAGGGTVVVPPGTYGLATTIALKSNVLVTGAGCGAYGQCATTLIAISAFSGTMASGQTSAATTQLSTVGLSNLALDGATTAADGLDLYSTTWSDFRHLFVKRVTANGIYLQPAAGATPNGQVAFNTFVEDYIDLSDASSVNAKGLVFGAGDAGDDVNRNTWIGGYIGNQSGTGFECGNADNNDFYNMVVQGGTGKSVDLLGSSVSATQTCRSNFFYGMTAGGSGTGGFYAEGGTYPSGGIGANIVYGLKLSDGENPPFVSTGAALIYHDDFGNIADFNASGGISWAGNISTLENLFADGMITGLGGSVVSSDVANVPAFTWAQLNTKFGGLANTGKAAFVYNYTNTAGETDLFINDGGLTPGGLNIYDFPSTTGTPTQLLSISVSNGLATPGNILANGTLTGLNGSVVSSDVANVPAYTWSQLNTKYGLTGTGKALFTYNYSNTAGETDLFINPGGLSPGGLNIYDFPTTSGTPTLNLTLSSAHGLSIGNPGGPTPSTGDVDISGAFKVAGVPIGSLGPPVVSKTGAYSVLSTDAGTWFNNTGASSGVVLTMPASPATNQTNCAIATVAQTIEFLMPSGTKVAVGATNGAAAGNLQSNTPFTMFCIWAQSSTQWVGYNLTGVWNLN